MVGCLFVGGKGVSALEVLPAWRMHVAMIDYLKCRGLYNRSELDRMEAETDNNSEIITSLQFKMDEAIVICEYTISNWLW
jgi:hypothetical protein